MDHSLEDGRLILVRPIESGDKAALSAGLLELSDLSVQRRFLSPKPSFSAAELRYLTEVDGHDHVAFVAEASDGHLVGVGRWVRLADEPGTAEAAIVVADSLQGLGLAPCWPTSWPARRCARTCSDSRPRCSATTCPRTA